MGKRSFHNTTQSSSVILLDPSNVVVTMARTKQIAKEKDREARAKRAKKSIASTADPVRLPSSPSSSTSFSSHSSSTKSKEKRSKKSKHHSTERSKKKKNKRKHPEEESKLKERRKHRWHPGTKALREIKAQQKNTKLIIPKAALLRLVKEIVHEHKPNLRIKESAFAALQHATEDYLISLFRDSMIIAANRDCKSLTTKDLRVVLHVRGDIDKWRYRPSSLPAGEASMVDSLLS